MKQFNELIQAQFLQLCAMGRLYRVELTGRDVWDLYLKSFTKDTNPKFRDPESSTKNCNHCNNFIRRYGNIVAVDKNFNIITLFDVIPVVDSDYTATAAMLSAHIRESPIKDIFIETLDSLMGLPYEKVKKNQEIFRLGTAQNFKEYTVLEAEKYGVVKAGEIKTFDHFHLDLPAKYVYTASNKSIDQLIGEARDPRNLFKKAMEIISMDTLVLVRDLINQGSLLNGETHKFKVEAMIPFKKEYDALSADKRENWLWVKADGFNLARFANELIGVFCIKLSEGEELNKACQFWNKAIDPVNYMKAVAPITEAQKAKDVKIITDLGYLDSFNRKLAVLEDIKVNEILHSNVGDGKIAAVSMFDSVKTISTRHKRNEFKGIEEVSIDKFMKDILPGVTSVEVFLENRLEGNSVTLTTSIVPEVKHMFGWDNPFSWTYKGNLAGKSQIKEAVKSHGGKVDGVLRFSIMWAEDVLGKANGDNSDLDAWCLEPVGGEKIYYGHARSTKTSGSLDVDIQTPSSYINKGMRVVENITYPSINKMIDGKYTFLVHQYYGSNSQGFTAEIEFGGEVFSYAFPTNIPQKGKVVVAEVTLKDGEFTISHKLSEATASRDIYGLPTEYFHKVNLMCLSPNHWGANKVGHKHYFFLLDKYNLDSPIRSFHSENLNAELTETRKTLERFGAVNMLEPADKQLSGIGFNATVKDSLIVKLAGSHKRTVRVNFGV